MSGNISIESSPSEVGLLQCLTHNYLCTSFDGLVQLNIDGVLQNVPLEFKTFSSYDSWEAYLQMANDVGKYNRCTFGDDSFKKLLAMWDIELKYSIIN